MADFSKYTDHEYVAMFPLLTGKPFDDLVDDIRLRGQLVEAVRFKGQTLDGRNRIRACVHLGIKPQFKEWRPPDANLSVETQILEFIVSMNLHRRQLSESQRAMIAASYYERIKHSRGRGRGCGRSAEKAAEMFDVSERMVQRAVHVERHRPELAKEVASGTKSVRGAYIECPAAKSGTSSHAQLRRHVLQTWRRQLRHREQLPEFEYAWESIKKCLEKAAEAEFATS